MSFAFGPAFGGVAIELPGKEAWAETGGDGLRLAGPGVVAEAVVGEAQRFGEHPAFAVVGGEEGVESMRLQVGESDLRQHGVAQLRVALFVHAPEAFGVKGSHEVLRVHSRFWVIAAAQEPRKIIGSQPEQMCMDTL